MSYHTDDTICAIGSATRGAARGMVRVSGRDAVRVVGRVFRASDRRALEDIRVPGAIGGQLHLELRRESARSASSPCPAPAAPTAIPCELFLWPSNRSYTREPVAELHTIGSPPVLHAALAAICRNGARLAEPGEFTLRAFLAGRLDLTQAEAVLGVIDAVDSDELDVALTQLAGGLARPLHSLRESLLQLLAELEAGLDFVEDDIEFISQDEVVRRLKDAGALLLGVEQQMQSRHVASDLAQVALVGEPNAGKSSLFNELVKKYGVKQQHAGSAAPALVSPIRGTTRDYLTAPVEFGGVRCELVDTAGIDEFAPADDRHSIAAAAQALAKERRKRAAVRALCVPATGPGVADWQSTAPEVERGRYDLVVITKSDLSANIEMNTSLSSVPVVVTSSLTGSGLGDFCSAVGQLLTRDAPAAHGATVSATADRCRESIQMARESVNQASRLAAASAGDELVAAEIRGALAELGKVVGAVYTDDLLDRIFKTFCIGK
jgi:tRNA modification GTPase